MPSTHTLLRYPGGKSKLYPFVSQLIEINRLQDGHYVEPFAGGSGLAMALLSKGVMRHLHLNDLDLSIYAFWYSVVNENKRFIKKIEETPINLKEWEHQVSIQKEKEKCDLFDIGFSTFFLNRTNRSGIINAGVIGGKAQNGKYKIDARFNKKNLIKKAELIGFYKQRFNLYNLDACEFLTNPSIEFPRNTLLNLDPPYYTNGQKLYQNWYAPDDHKKIAQLAPKLENYWIITYDNAPPIKKLYQNLLPIEYNLRYCAQKRVMGKELLIADARLKRPDFSILGSVA